MYVITFTLGFSKGDQKKGDNISIGFFEAQVAVEALNHWEGRDVEGGNGE